MLKKLKSQRKLKEELIQLTKKGIQANMSHLKKDMCAQFADPYEFAREYVVNAYDAQATWCTIHGTQTDGDITIIIQDNGHGMDKSGLLNFFTLYRSRKKGDPSRAIGKFGIGKLSVAAIPGQKTFKMLTSTGTDCWEATAGSLLTNDTIELHQIRPIPDQGTRFEICFDKKEDVSLILKKLSEILQRYTRFLDMDVMIYHPHQDEDGKEMLVEELIQDVWSRKRKYAKRFAHQLVDGNAYDIIMELDQSAEHELYQNRVFIANQYNLVSYGLENSFRPPYLNIKIDSPAFRLPFGRHCLADEDCLGALSAHIRKKLLPDFFVHVLNQVEERTTERWSRYHTMLSEMSTVLIRYCPGLDLPWSQVPVFKIFPDKYVSLNHLEEATVQSGKIYIAEPEAVGVDYDYFDGPVIMNEQVTGGLIFLQQYFQKEIINLSLKDVVIEAPTRFHKSPSEEEMNFQKYLGFHQDLDEIGIRKEYGLSESKWNEIIEGDFGLIKIDRKTQDLSGAQRIKKAFLKLSWRVNYLVSKDGKTPCTTHKFIINQAAIILNLFHPDIKRLVKLSRVAPKLAGHWAIALCLTENTGILSYLSADAREDLLMLDALAKINNTEETQQPDRKNGAKRFKDLIHDSDFDFSEN